MSMIYLECACSVHGSLKDLETQDVGAGSAKHSVSFSHPASRCGHSCSKKSHFKAIDVVNIQVGSLGSHCKEWTLQMAVRGHCDANCTRPCYQFPVLPDGTLNAAAKLNLTVQSAAILCLTAGEVARMPFTKLTALWKVGSHCPVTYCQASSSYDVPAISAKQSSTCRLALVLPIRHTCFLVLL